MHRITSVEQLEQHYRAATPQISKAELDHINGQCAAFIRKSSFMILATHGEHGIDCSPRGEPAGFVRVVNPHCLHIPDRTGNNRLGTLRNILHDSHIGMLFVVAGAGEILRVSGRANIVVDPELCESFSINGKPANSVITMHVERAMLQCQKAIMCSQLWEPATWPDRTQPPTTEDMEQVLITRHLNEMDARECPEPV